MKAVQEKAKHVDFQKLDAFEATSICLVYMLSVTAGLMLGGTLFTFQFTFGGLGSKKIGNLKYQVAYFCLVKFWCLSVKNFKGLDKEF